MLLIVAMMLLIVANSAVLAKMSWRRTSFALDPLAVCGVGRFNRNRTRQRGIGLHVSRSV